MNFVLRVVNRGTCVQLLVPNVAEHDGRSTIAVRVFIYSYQMSLSVTDVVSEQERY